MRKLLAAFFGLVLFLPAAHARDPVVAVVRLEAPIREPLVASVAAELVQARRQAATELVVRIDSPGGSLGDMMEIIKAITATGLPTTCIVGDMAASAAFIILQSEACTVRVVRPYSILMAHSVRAVLSSSASAVELLEHAQDLERMDRIVALRISARLELSPDAYLAKIRGKEWTVLGEDAITQRMADKILP